VKIIETMLALCATAFLSTAFAQAPQSKFAEVNGIRIHYLDKSIGIVGHDIGLMVAC
jgi:hypothetical protein